MITRLTGFVVAAWLAGGCADPMPRLEDAKAPTPTPVSGAARTTPTPRPQLAIDNEMRRWANRYVELLTPVGAAVLSINAAEPTRDTCNTFITAVYNAKHLLPQASDPDVAKAVATGLESAVLAGGACLREERAPRDIYLTLAGAGFQLAQQLVDERYHLSIAVRGISDIVGGKERSAIAARAIAAAPAVAAQAAAAAVPEPLNDRLRMTDAHAQVTEANDSWRRFAWQLTLHNVSNEALTFTLSVEFTDGAGFTIDKDVVYNVALPPGGARAMSGDTLISMPAALRVAGIRGKAE